MKVHFPYVPRCVSHGRCDGGRGDGSGGRGSRGRGTCGGFDTADGPASEFSRRRNWEWIQFKSLFDLDCSLPSRRRGW